MIKGCTDGGCMWRRPKGMSTNGGCNCEKELRPLPFDLRIQVIRNARHQRDKIERLRKALTGLLADTQHSEHYCGDRDCPVVLARAALEQQS